MEANRQVFHCKKPCEPEAYKVAASGILLHVPHSHSDFPLPRLSQNTEYVGWTRSHATGWVRYLLTRSWEHWRGVCISVWVFAHCVKTVILWRGIQHCPERNVDVTDESLSSHCRAWCHVNCFATAGLDASDSFCRRSRWNKAEAAEVCPWHFKHAWETHQAANENEMVQESFGSIDHVTFLFTDDWKIATDIPASPRWLQACSNISKLISTKAKRFPGSLYNLQLNIQVLTHNHQSHNGAETNRDWRIVTYSKKSSSLVVVKNV